MNFKNILEAVRKKKVIRKGKVQWRRYSTREGYKVVNGKEVRISPRERRKRKLAAKKASVKRRTSKASSNISRKRSLRKRRSITARDIRDHINIGKSNLISEKVLSNIKEK